MDRGRREREKGGKEEDGRGERAKKRREEREREERRREGREVGGSEKERSRGMSQKDKPGRQTAPPRPDLFILFCFLQYYARYMLLLVSE